MDGHSKNVFLIGVLHIVGYLMFSFEPLTRAIRLINSAYYDKEWSSPEPIFLLALVGFSALMAILAGVMLRGVVQKRHALVAPFLVVNSLISGAIIILFLTHLVLDYYTSLYYVDDSLFAIGFQIMALYPIYTLFMKLRFQSAKTKSIENSSIEYENKLDVILTKQLSV